MISFWRVVLILKELTADHTQKIFVWKHVLLLAVHERMNNLVQEKKKKVIDSDGHSLEKSSVIFINLRNMHKLILIYNILFQTWYIH